MPNSCGSVRVLLTRRYAILIQLYILRWTPAAIFKKKFGLHPCKSAILYLLLNSAARSRLKDKLQRVQEKTPPKYNGVAFEILGKYEIEFFLWDKLAHICTLCAIKSWKINVKIIFYYMFSITRPKHKFPRQHGLMHVHQFLKPFSWRRTLIKTRSSVLNTILLWSPYGIGQTIIFSCCGMFFLLLLSFLFLA